MNWLVFALSGPVLWAISTHLDKYLVERYFKEVEVGILLIFTALMGLALMPVIAFFDPAVLHRDLQSIALMTLSGLLYMTAIFFYLRALQGHEASVVAPFFQASPLFGYALGYLVLSETLSGSQLAGCALILGGILFVSVGARRSEPFRWRLALLMLSCGFVMSLSTLIFKVFAVKDEFWATTFWMFAGEAIFGFVYLSIGNHRREFFRLFREHPVAMVAINASNELVNLGGALGNRYALIFAPLAVVQAIGSTTTLFVFAIGVALTLLWPRVSHESLAPRDLMQKGAAALLVAAGIVLVSR